MLVALISQAYVEPGQEAECEVVAGGIATNKGEESFVTT